MGEGGKQITKDTTVCISIAERPGNFGATIFNAAFQALGLDFIYKPFAVSSGQLEGVVAGIKSLGIKGCGVSMPHKSEVIKYLDSIDSVAKEIGAVNTIVNERGFLIGYNTDFLGAQRALSEIYDVNQKKVLVIGAGGAAKAITAALKSNGAGSVYVSDRDDNNKGQWRSQSFDLLVNATSVGMAPNNNEMIINENDLNLFDAVMDVVINPPQSLLLKSAEKFGKVTVPGHKMALYQAAAQFKLYTGIEAPMEIMEQSLSKLFNNV